MVGCFRDCLGMNSIALVLIHRTLQLETWCGCLVQCCPKQVTFLQCRSGTLLLLLQILSNFRIFLWLFYLRYMFTFYVMYVCIYSQSHLEDANEIQFYFWVKQNRFIPQCEIQTAIPKLQYDSQSSYKTHLLLRPNSNKLHSATIYQ